MRMLMCFQSERVTVDTSPNALRSVWGSCHDYLQGSLVLVRDINYKSRDNVNDTYDYVVAITEAPDNEVDQLIRGTPFSGILELTVTELLSSMV